MDKQNLIEDITKIAGFSPKGALKAVGRTVSGTALGAGIGATKAISQNEKDPFADTDAKNSNIITSSLAGGLIGGAIGGPGIGVAKSGAKKLSSKVTGIFKKSEMEVPNEEESGKEVNKDKEEVLNSPNEEEKKRMTSSISEKDELKEYYKNKIKEKAASEMPDTPYMQTIKCEECGFEGKPLSSDGRCP